MSNFWQKTVRILTRNCTFNEGTKLEPVCRSQLARAAKNRPAIFKMALSPVTIDEILVESFTMTCQEFSNFGHWLQPIPLSMKPSIKESNHILEHAVSLAGNLPWSAYDWLTPFFMMYCTFPWGVSIIHSHDQCATNHLQKRRLHWSVLTPGFSKIDLFLKFEEWHIAMYIQK